MWNFVAAILFVSLYETPSESAVIKDPPWIRFCEPYDGAKYTRESGYKMRVEWQSWNIDPLYTVTLEYRRNSGGYNSISGGSSITNDGHFTWTLPNLDRDDNYRLYISVDQDSGINDESGYFSFVDNPQEPNHWTDILYNHGNYYSPCACYVYQRYVQDNSNYVFPFVDYYSGIRSQTLWQDWEVGLSYGQTYYLWGLYLAPHGSSGVSKYEDVIIAVKFVDDSVTTWQNAQTSGFEVVFNRPIYRSEINPDNWYYFEFDYPVAWSYGTGIVVEFANTNGPNKQTRSMGTTSWIMTAEINWTYKSAYIKSDQWQIGGYQQGQWNSGTYGSHSYNFPLVRFDFSSSLPPAGEEPTQLPSDQCGYALEQRISDDVSWLQLSGTDDLLRDCENEDFPPCREGASTTMWNGAMYLYGGVGRFFGADDFMGDVWKFDLIGNGGQWEQMLDVSPDSGCSVTAYSNNDFSGDRFTFSAKTPGDVDAYADLTTINFLNIFSSAVVGKGCLLEIWDGTNFNNNQDWSSKTYGIGNHAFQSPYNDDVESLKVYNIDPPNARRAYHSAVVYNDKMYVFGGINDGGLVSDINELDLNTLKWRWIVVPESIAPRYGHRAVVFDTEMIIYGGTGVGGTPTNEMLRFRPADDSWTVPPPEGSDVTCADNGSPCVTEHSLVVEAASGVEVMYLFAGTHMDPNTQAIADENSLWRWNGSTWELFEASDCANTQYPPCRHGHVAQLKYVGTQHYMIIFGGQVDGNLANDVWDVELFSIDILFSWLAFSLEICATNYQGPECTINPNMVSVSVVDQTVVLFGGKNVKPGIQLYLNSLWVFRKKPILDPPAQALPAVDTTGGISLTLTGKNFGLDGTAIDVFLGDNRQYICENVAMTDNDREVTCTIPEGVGPNIRATLVVHSGAPWTVEGEVYFSYKPPVISSVDVPPSIPVDGGATLVIHGSQFGPDGDAHVTLREDVKCQELSNDHSTIWCNVPEGTGVNLNISVTVGGVLATTPTTFSYDPAVITGLSWSRAPTTNVIHSVVILGYNFYAEDLGAQVANYSCQSLRRGVQNVDGTDSLACVFPNYAGTGLEVAITSITLPGGKLAADQTFSYDKPEMHGVYASSAPTDGTQGISLYIAGNNFGSGGATIDIFNELESSLSVTVDSAACTSPSFRDMTECQSKFDTQIPIFILDCVECTLPSGSGVNVTVLLTVKGQTAETPALFSFDPPLIFRLDGQFDEATTTGGDTLIVRGENFGSDPNQVTVTIANNDCPVQAANSDETTIMCTIGPGGGAGLFVTVTVNGQDSTPNEALHVSYAHPLIISDPVITPDGALPTAGGAQMVITGYNFGANVPVQLWIGDCTELCFECDSAFLSYSDTSVTCSNTPPGIGEGLQIRLVIAGLVAEQLQDFQVDYKSASLDGVNYPTTGPGGGTVLSILGNDFGPDGINATVFVGGSLCTNVSRVSHEELECITPSGYGANLDVIVQVDDQDPLTLEEGFDYSPPALSSVIIEHNSTKGGALIQIFGENFGQTEREITVKVGTWSATNTVYYNDTYITSTLPPGAGTSHQISIAVDGREVIWGELFDYAAPQIDSIRFPGGRPTVGGETVQIYGTGFGLEISPTQQNRLVYFDGQPISNGVLYCATSNPDVEECLKFTLPSGSGMGKMITASIMQQTSNTAYFDYDPPVILQLDPLSPQDAPTDGGSILTLLGRDFGPPGAVEHITVGGHDCTIQPGTDTPEHDRINCVVPPGAGTDLMVYLTVSGQTTANNEVLFSYVHPTVEVVAFDFPAPTKGGFSATVTGRNFGPQDGNHTIVLRFGDDLCDAEGVVQIAGGGNNWCDRPCDNVTWVNHNQLTCDSIPNGVGRNYIKVVVDGQSSDFDLSCYNYGRPEFCAVHYDQPSFLDLNPIDGVLLSVDQPMVRGDSLALVGQNFGPNLSSYPPHLQQILQISGNPCQITTWISDQEINCVVPSGAGSDLMLTAVIGGTAFDLPSNFNVSYKPPIVTSIQWTTGQASTSGGDFLQINGANFADDDVVDVARDIRIGSWKCEVVESVDTQMNCTIPPGSGRNLDVVVRIQGQEVNAPSKFFYDPPEIVDFELPTGASTEGGNRLSAIGRSFGGKHIPSVRLGHQSCVGVSLTCLEAVEQDDNLDCLTCRIPMGSGGDHNVVITLSQQESPPFAKAFKYDDPQIELISFENDHAPTNGGVALTLTGTNFGDPESLIVRHVWIGEIECLDLDVRDHQTMTCTLPPGVGGGLNVTAEVDGLRSVKTNALSYNPPVVLDIKEYARDGGDVSLLIYGLEFGPEGSGAVVRVGSEECTQTHWGNAISNELRSPSDHTLLTCDLPFCAGSNIDIYVDVGGQTSLASPEARIDCARPQISSIQWGELPEDSNEGAPNVTIRGSHFGGDSHTPVVFIGEEEDCECIVHGHTSTTILCEPCGGAGANLTVRVRVAGQTSRANITFNYPPPVLDKVHFESDQVYTRGGGIVTLVGKNFGANHNTRVVHLDREGDKQIDCLDVDRIASDELECTVQEGQGGGWGVQLVVEEQPANINDQQLIIVQFSKPKVNATSPKVIVDKSVRLTIQGDNFGTSGKYLSIEVENVECRDPIYFNHTTIYCFTPVFGKGLRNYSLTVEVDGVISDAYDLLILYPTIPANILNAMQIFAILTIVAMVLVGIAIFVYRARKDIAATSPLFSFFILAGGIVGVASIFNLHSYTGVECHVSYWCFNVGFSLLFGSLLLKNYRILKMYNRRLDRYKIPITRLLLYIGLLVMLDFMLLMPLSLMSDCGWPDQAFGFVFLVSIILYKAITLVTGTVVAMKSRRIKWKEYNERVEISYAIYNFTVFLLILAPLGFAMRREFVDIYAIRCVSICVVTIITIIILFYPKFARVYSESKANPGGVPMSQSSFAVSMSTFDTRSTGAQNTHESEMKLKGTSSTVQTTGAGSGNHPGFY